MVKRLETAFGVEPWTPLREERLQFFSPSPSLLKESLPWNWSPNRPSPALSGEELSAGSGGSAFLKQFIFGRISLRKKKPTGCQPRRHTGDSREGSPSPSFLCLRSPLLGCERRGEGGGDGSA